MRHRAQHAVPLRSGAESAPRSPCSGHRAPQRRNVRARCRNKRNRRSLVGRKAAPRLRRSAAEWASATWRDRNAKAECRAEARRYEDKGVQAKEPPEWPHKKRCSPEGGRYKVKDAKSNSGSQDVKSNGWGQDVRRGRLAPFPGSLVWRTSWGGPEESGREGSRGTKGDLGRVR